MKILSSLVNFMKKERNACHVPVLSFEEHKVTRGERPAKTANPNDDFAKAYLAHVRSLLADERNAQQGMPAAREKTALARRALSYENCARGLDELDEMIESLSLLGGLNVSERAYYARPRRK